ncbi:ribosomal protein L3 glutamine methyltransferase [Comamonas sp. BIGb0152]|uniref:50S ribosomal protein L3 N(5)-glutamine methyltransferase n=1 Tax=Comamonas sp. BIGb0152 TaxID=2940601 RepID=UPI00216700A0|nr:50S ribosomal protein L3 N(5)-glutamine methyltransferase [Comamonas sp. BIGb0152]MCS4292854.1 ribosomal protein L3 glutamine methyltransferase [Comamonas sp. BIGb0152]
MTTIRTLIDDSAAALSAAGVHFGHGTTNAQDEASWLVLWSLGLPVDSDTSPDGADSVASQAVSDAQRSKLEQLIAERIRSRKPAAYLTQQAWLQGVAFYIDERSIVPRSLIAELLADGSIDDWLSDKTRQVLDLCTGNGSLACLAAMAYPDVQVTGADLSADALAVARINVDQHGLQDRVQLVESDGMAQAHGPWDLILCNPPYVNAQSMASLPPEYQAEPALALAGGQDGMDFVRGLILALPQHLNEDGVLVLEIGNEREYFEAAFPGLPVFWMDTSAGDEQVLLLTREALMHWSQEQPTQL